MDTVQTTTARPHIVWLDVLRLVAILMVIAIHCTDPFNASPESRANPEFNFWGSVYGSMLSASVPLFLMMVHPVDRRQPGTGDGLFPLGTKPFGLVCRGVEDDRFDPCNLYGLCDANVVYLCADRTLSVYAGLFRMGGKGVG